MTETIPEYVQATGMVQVSWVDAIANIEAPTTTELNAGVMLACFSPDDWEGLTAEPEITEQTRMCLRDTFEVVNRIKRGISNFNLTYLPQLLKEATPDAANKAYNALTPDAEGHLVVRYGHESRTDYAADDVVDIQPAAVVTRTKATTATNDGGPLTFSSQLSARPGFVEDVAVVAGA